MVKFRNSRAGSRKPSLTTSQTLIITLFVTLTFLILILLTLRIPKFNHLNSISHSNALRSEDDDSKRWVEIISWEPRAFVYHNFLTKKECEHLVNLAKPSMKKSTVVDSETGKSVDSRVRTSSGTFLKRGHDKIVTNIEKRIADFTFIPTKKECEHLVNLAKPSMKKSTVVDSETGKSVDSRVRTSSGTFLKRGHDKIVTNIEKRIADFTFIPVEHGEGFNVLHYEVGQHYVPHYDYFADNFNTMNGGQRIATMLMYLSDVEEGGETVFPAAKGNISSVPWWNELSDCGKKGLSIKPKMGDAILFWSMKPDATLDTSSLHGACPVIKGDKWSCAKWMRVDEFRI